MPSKAYLNAPLDSASLQDNWRAASHYTCRPSKTRTQRLTTRAAQTKQNSHIQLLRSSEKVAARGMELYLPGSRRTDPRALKAERQYPIVDSPRRGYRHFKYQRPSNARSYSNSVLRHYITSIYGTTITSIPTVVIVNDTSLQLTRLHINILTNP